MTLLQLLFWFDFWGWTLRIGQKYKNIFVYFLVQMKTFKSPFKINNFYILFKIKCTNKILQNSITWKWLQKCLSALCSLFVTSIICNYRGSLVSAVLISAVPSLVQFTNRTKPHSIVLFPNLVRFSFQINSKFDKKNLKNLYFFSFFFYFISSCS